MFASAEVGRLQLRVLAAFRLRVRGSEYSGMEHPWLRKIRAVWSLIHPQGQGRCPVVGSASIRPIARTDLTDQAIGLCEGPGRSD